MQFYYYNYYLNCFQIIEKTKTRGTEENFIFLSFSPYVLYEYGACYQNSPTVTGTEAYMYCCIYLVECFCNMLFIMPHQMHCSANFQAPPSAVDFQ